MSDPESREEEVLQDMAEQHRGEEETGGEENQPSPASELEEQAAGLAELFQDELVTDAEESPKAPDEEVSPPEAPEEKSQEEELSGEEQAEEEESSTSAQPKVTLEQVLEELQRANQEIAALKEGAKREESEQPSGEKEEEPSLDPTEARGQAREFLEGVYALSEEDADAVLESPEKVLPRLMAEMHLKILEQVAGVVKAQVPSLVDHTLQSATQQRTWEQEFFSRWPALQDFREEVVETRRALKSLHPDIDEQRLDQEVGAYVSLRHGLVQRGEASKPSTATSRRSTAHRPLGRGPGPTPTERKAPDNPYAEMAEEDLREAL